MDMQDMRENKEGGMCGMCHGHGMCCGRRHFGRIIIKILVVVFVFWLGFQLGEFRGMFRATYGYGYGMMSSQNGNKAYYGGWPGMMGWWTSETASQSTSTPTSR